MEDAERCSVKKGCRKLLENYREISLILNTTYKVCTIINRNCVNKMASFLRTKWFQEGEVCADNITII